MQSLSLQSSPNPWLLRLVTFLVAAMAAASVGYWALKWPAPASSVRAMAPEPVRTPIDTAKVARLLGANPNASAAGAQPPVTSAQAKYKLQGVIALSTRGGSALIAINDEPAKPYRVGERVSDDLLLQSVKARSATLANNLQGSGSVTLELPPLPGAQ